MHPFSPDDYYLEGLRRDPSDIRLNNGYGLLQYRRGNFEEAIKLFKPPLKNKHGKIQIHTTENVTSILVFHFDDDRKA